MRLLISLAALALALLVTGTAQAGGWATVGLSTPPSAIDAGETWRAQITVLRHGVTPTDGARPSMIIRDYAGGETQTFLAEPTGEIGVYEAAVAFPGEGEWHLVVDDGLVATGYGASRTTSFGSLTVGPVVGVGSDGFPVLPLAAAVAVALAAAAGIVGARRLKRLPAASH
jgi:hypothetical protein